MLFLEEEVALQCLERFNPPPILFDALEFFRGLARKRGGRGGDEFGKSGDVELPQTTLKRLRRGLGEEVDNLFGGGAGSAENEELIVEGAVWREVSLQQIGFVSPGGEAVAFGFLHQGDGRGAAGRGAGGGAYDGGDAIERVLNGAPAFGDFSAAGDGVYGGEAGEGGAGGVADDARQHRRGSGHVDDHGRFIAHAFLRDVLVGLINFLQGGKQQHLKKSQLLLGLGACDAGLDEFLGPGIEDAEEFFNPGADREVLRRIGVVGDPEKEFFLVEKGGKAQRFARLEERWNDAATGFATQSGIPPDGGGEVRGLAGESGLLESGQFIHLAGQDVAGRAEGWMLLHGADDPTQHGSEGFVIVQGEQGLTVDVADGEKIFIKVVLQGGQFWPGEQGGILSHGKFQMLKIFSGGEEDPVVDCAPGEMAAFGAQGGENFTEQPAGLGGRFRWQAGKRAVFQFLADEGAEIGGKGLEQRAVGNGVVGDGKVVFLPNGEQVGGQDFVEALGGVFGLNTEKKGWDFKPADEVFEPGKGGGGIEDGLKNGKGIGVAEAVLESGSRSCHQHPEVEFGIKAVEIAKRGEVGGKARAAGNKEVVAPELFQRFKRKVAGVGSRCFVVNEGVRILPPHGFVQRHQMVFHADGSEKKFSVLRQQGGEREPLGLGVERRGTGGACGCGFFRRGGLAFLRFAMGQRQRNGREDQEGSGKLGSGTTHGEKRVGGGSDGSFGE